MQGRSAQPVSASSRSGRRNDLWSFNVWAWELQRAATAQERKRWALARGHHSLCLHHTSCVSCCPTLARRCRPSPNLAAADGTTPLAAAVRDGNLRTVQALLRAGAKADAAAADGTAPMHLAAANGDVPAIEELIAAGASVSAKRKVDGLTPVHLAAAAGKAEALRALLAAGANPEASAKKAACKSTPLHMAAAAGHAEACAVLLSGGANVDSTGGRAGAGGGGGPHVPHAALALQAAPVQSAQQACGSQAEACLLCTVLHTPSQQAQPPPCGTHAQMWMAPRPCTPRPRMAGRRRHAASWSMLPTPLPPTELATRRCTAWRGSGRGGGRGTLPGWRARCWCRAARRWRTTRRGRRRCLLQRTWASPLSTRCS